MDKNAVKTAIKTFLADNTSTFVSGLMFQGQEIRVPQISKTNLTPLSDYVYIALRVPNAREFKRGSVNTRLGVTAARYDVEILIAGQAELGYGEDQPYENAAETFDRFVGRIVKQVKAQRFFTSGNSKFELDPESENNIEVLDFSGTTFDTEDNAWASLFNQINFTLYEACVNDSAL